MECLLPMRKRSLHWISLCLQTSWSSRDPGLMLKTVSWWIIWQTDQDASSTKSVEHNHMESVSMGLKLNLKVPECPSARVSSSHSEVSHTSYSSMPSFNWRSRNIFLRSNLLWALEKMRFVSTVFAGSLSIFLVRKSSVISNDNEPEAKQFFDDQEPIMQHTNPCHLELLGFWWLHMKHEDWLKQKDWSLLTRLSISDLYFLSNTLPRLARLRSLKVDLGAALWETTLSMKQILSECRPLKELDLSDLTTVLGLGLLAHHEQTFEDVEADDERLWNIWVISETTAIR